MIKFSIQFIKGNKAIYKTLMMSLALILSLFVFFKMSENIVYDDLDNQFSFYRSNEIFFEDDSFILPNDNEIIYQNQYLILSGSSKYYTDGLGNFQFISGNIKYYICNDFSTIKAKMEKDFIVEDIAIDGIYVSERFLSQYQDNDYIFYCEGEEYKFLIKGIYKNVNDIHIIDNTKKVDDNCVFMTMDYFLEHTNLEIQPCASYLLSKPIDINYFNEIKRLNTQNTVRAAIEILDFNKNIAKPVVDVIQMITYFVLIIALIMYVILSIISYIESFQDRIVLFSLGITKKNLLIFNATVNLLSVFIPFIFSTIIGFIILGLYRILGFVDDFSSLFPLLPMVMLSVISVSIFTTIINYFIQSKINYYRKVD